MVDGYLVKQKVLEYLGWETYYHSDNWIKASWIDDEDVNYSWAGLSTEDAFGKAVKESGKTINELLIEIEKNK